MYADQAVVEHNITHRNLYTDLYEAIEILKKRFLEKSSPITIEEASMILEDLASFPLGQHILLAGGANGMWTDYLISPQEYFGEKGLVDLDLSVVERFFLFNSPAVLAQRELQSYLKKIAQSHVGNGKVFASIPCGMMRDLLSLDYSKVRDISLFGIDIDKESIERSKALAKSLQVNFVSYAQEDAWNLSFKNTFDFISSIGLNMYEKDQDKVVELYRNLYEALKPGGVLFTGVMTWPSYLDSRKSDWIIELIPKYDLHLETVIHRDILNIQWFNCRTLAEAADDFKKAGFSHVEIVPDSRCIFPAIIAIK